MTQVPPTTARRADGKPITPDTRFHEIVFKASAEPERTLSKRALAELERNKILTLQSVKDYSRDQLSRLLLPATKFSDFQQAANMADKVIAAMNAAGLKPKMPPVSMNVQVPHGLYAASAEVAKLLPKVNGYEQTAASVVSTLLASVMNDAILTKLGELKKKVLLEEAKRLREAAAELETQAAA